MLQGYEATSLIFLWGWIHFFILFANAQSASQQSNLIPPFCPLNLLMTEHFGA